MSFRYSLASNRITPVSLHLYVCVCVGGYGKMSLETDEIFLRTSIW